MIDCPSLPLPTGGRHAKQQVMKESTTIVVLFINMHRLHSKPDRVPPYASIRVLIESADPTCRQQPRGELPSPCTAGGNGCGLDEPPWDIDLPVTTCSITGPFGELVPFRGGSFECAAARSVWYVSTRRRHAISAFVANSSSLYRAVGPSTFTTACLPLTGVDNTPSTQGRIKTVFRVFREGTSQNILPCVHWNKIIKLLNTSCLKKNFPRFGGFVKPLHFPPHL